MTHDYDDIPGIPAFSCTYRTVGCSRLSAEFTSAREYRAIRMQQKQAAHRRWLAKPGNREKALEAVSNWKRRQ